MKHMRTIYMMRILKEKTWGSKPGNYKTLKNLNIQAFSRKRQRQKNDKYNKIKQGRILNSLW